MNFKGPLEDRIYIRELQESFGDAINRKDKIEWLALWDDNAEWVAGNQTAVGKANISMQWELFYSPFNPSRNNETRFYRSTPAALNVTDSTALGRFYIEVLIIYGGTLAQKTYFYLCEETYLKKDNHWLITSRMSSRIHPR